MKTNGFLLLERGKKMKNLEKLKIVLAGMIILVLCIGIGFKIYKEKMSKNADIHVNLSLEDKVMDNTIWCGTFNLLWNDLKDLAGQDIVFSPQLEIVNRLNKGTFTTKELNENSYYKVVDTPSLDLKKKIENELQEKFKETSDILNDFSWGNYNEKDYFLYTMLKKEFEFENEFTELKNGTFNNTKNVQYFGIDASTKEFVRKQVEVLYYKDTNHFAIKLKTKGDDEIILTRGNDKTSFKEIYDAILKENEDYQGNKSFGENDTLKIPNLNFKVKKEFTELEHKEFTFANGENYFIDKALQTIQLELNKKGGKVKSEAGMDVKNCGLKDSENSRHFHLDHTFTLFLKEKESNLPYLAIQIEDINQFR